MGKVKKCNAALTERTPCTFCQGRQFVSLFTASDFDTGKESFQLMECTQCRLVRTEPILDAFQLQKYYSLPYYGSDKDKFKGLVESITYWLNSRRAGSILALLGRDRVGVPPRILDVGCGRGNFLRVLSNKGCDCYGVERTEFPDRGPTEGIHFFKGNLCDLGFEDNFFDAVVLWHVLEHMENPSGIVHEIARILRPGGLLVVAVPNFGSFQARWFQARWFHLDLPRHIHHFNQKTLLACLSSQGFTICTQNTFSLEQNPFGFVQSLFNGIGPKTRSNRFYSLLKKNNTSASRISFLAWVGFAALIFPFTILEYLVSGLTGQGATLIVYAEKT